jgi:hypothetical protein
MSTPSTGSGRGPSTGPGQVPPAGLGQARELEYAGRLFLAWLNERWQRAFQLEGPGDGIWTAAEPDQAASPPRLAICVQRLVESDDAWAERRAALVRRLDEARPGSFLLWLPPGARLPAEEPEESEWVRRVVLAASRLASGRQGEVRLPAKLVLAKTRDEGGYASVTGGLSRHWTKITEQVNGTFYVDSRAINRLTRDEAEREQLIGHIGLLSQGVEKGQAVDFESEDAWSLQRLPRGAGLSDGWAITGCPPGFDPSDGAVIRRLLRARLAAAKEAFAARAADLRALVLVGAYDYIESENAGASLRGFDPALAASLDLVVVVADAEVKPVQVSRNLPW